MSWQVAEPATMVSSSRAVSGASTTFSGENYDGSPFSPAVDETDYVSARFRPDGTATIVFSQPVANPILHFDNLQGVYEFSEDFRLLSGGSWSASTPFTRLGEIVVEDRRIALSTTGELDQLSGTVVFPGRHSQIVIRYVEGREQDSAQFQWGLFRPTQHVDWRTHSGASVTGVLPIEVDATWSTVGLEAPGPLTRTDGLTPTFDGTEYDPVPFSPPQLESDRVAATFRPGPEASIEFSRPVLDPILHITNLQGTLRFSAPFEVLSGAVYSSRPKFVVVGEILVGGEGTLLGRPEGDAERLDQIAATLIFPGRHASIRMTLVEGIDEDTVLMQWGAREDLFEVEP